MQQTTLGRTGITTSVLAVGTGTRGWAGRSAQTDKGAAWLSGLLRGAAELGITFWDLADEYGSHAAAAAALRGMSRESLTIVTKTTAQTADECSAALHRFLAEIGTDHLDIVLLHAISEASWNRSRSGAMEALCLARQAGTVRAVGVSVHSLAALRSAVEDPWVDVVLARLNYAGVNMDAPPRVVAPLLREARARGKGVYAMKVLGCGDLAGDVERAVGFVAESGAVDAMTIGPTEDRHLAELARVVDARWRS
jgi:1-deoxyxylulose-5-phosphate synthase